MTVVNRSVTTVPTALIRAGKQQARRNFNQERLAELAQSIRECGVLQPVVLRSRRSGDFELLAGERRWRAAQLAGLHELPAIVRDDLDDQEAQVLGLVENLQREALSPVETAQGLQQLLHSLHLTHEQAGRKIGKSRAYVTNFLRLLELDPKVHERLDDGRLSLGHAKVLCGLPRPIQRRLAYEAADRQLSVRALETRATREKRCLDHRLTPRSGSANTSDLARLQRALGDYLGYAVQLQAGAHGGGKLSVRFDSLDELDGLLARIGYQSDT